MMESVSGTTDRDQRGDAPIIRNAALQELLSRLPRNSVQAFTLHYLDGYSIQDIAFLVEKRLRGP